MTDEEGNHIVNEDDNNINAGKVMDAIKYLVELLNARGFLERIFADLQSSWYWILAGQGVSMVVAFLWIFLMRLIAGVMVWLSLILTILLLATSTAFSWF